MKWQTRIETLIRTCQRREANRGTYTGVQKEEYADLGIRENEMEAAMEKEFYRRSTIWGRKFAIEKCRLRWCVGTRVYIEDQDYDFFFFFFEPKRKSPLSHFVHAGLRGYFSKVQALYRVK